MNEPKMGPTQMRAEISVELPIARRVGSDYAPLPGVAWIYPPTKNNPQQTIVEAK